MGLRITDEAVYFGDEKYPRARLNADELAILKAEFETLFNVDSSVERQVFKDRFDTIVACIEAIKYALDKRPFKGVLPSDTELGWSKIRPGHLGKSNWKVSLVAGWQDWLGTWTSPWTAPKDAGFIIIGLKSYSASPKLSEVHVKIGRHELVPVDVRYIKGKDNPHGVSIAVIPTILILPEQEVAIKFAADEAGDDEIEPLGITVGLGRFLKKETY